ncbi:MAG: stage II sporulation protein R [Oscillospiraceae bacterium]|nr:stage II sporulation protein R [Oscillospiraceae bacterium]
MKRKGKLVGICLLISAVCFLVGLLRDRAVLNTQLIRLHVVANSDADADQLVKLRVRDAVMDSIRQDLAGIADVESAKAYLQENLPKIRKIADLALETAGFSEKTSVTLCRESFDTRHYDTFSLPAGIYESLRIVIGEGAGRNWWCVAFPTLCIPASGAGFREAAQTGGFSEALTDTLQNGTDCEIRFFLLDALGNLERKLFPE